MKLVLFRQSAPSVEHSVTATTTATTLAIPTSLIPGEDGDGLLVTNLGPDDAYIATASSGATAVVGTGLPILARSQIVIRRPGHTSIAAICPTSTATLVYTPGTGN